MNTETTTRIDTKLPPSELATQFQSELGCAREALQRTICVPELPAEHAPEQAYNAIAEGRLVGDTTVLYRTTQADDRIPALLGLSPFAPRAPSSTYRYFAGSVDRALHGAFEGSSSAAQLRLRGTFISQIERVLDAHVAQFYRGSWAVAVLGRTLSREQYVATLENMHQYVRFTTRLLGRAVAHSQTTALRAHFAGHLRGEINHEILLERDLKNMGVSTEFLLSARYPNAATRAFMVLQQSLVAFEQDPILFAACPLAAEAITARMNAEFLQALRDNVATYDVASIERSTVFFSSHIETDGGDDGHWAATMRILESNLPNELRLGEFLTLIDLAARTFTETFNANVDELVLFTRYAPSMR